MSKNVLDYSKWDNLDYESDEDDCHPNIEINTWRRLKERKRQEEGKIKKEPVLNDKWNTTSVNTKIKDERIDKSIDKQASNVKKYEEPELIGVDGIPESKRYMYSKEKPPPEKVIEQNPFAKKYNYKPGQNDTVDNTNNDENINTNTTTNGNNQTKNNNTKQTTQNTKTNSTSTTKKTSKSSNNESKTNEKEEEPFKARSNPSLFLEENLSKLRKFTKIKDDLKADEYLIKNPELVHEASEGYLITFAVDRAVEGADTREIERLARRTLTIHNLVASCQQGNIKPELGVKMFYTKLNITRFKEEYNRELFKQTKELIYRIEQRRIERIREAEEKLKNNEIVEEYDENEKAPVGPGGLDPTEVLNSLPEEMQKAFLSRNIEALKEAMMNMTQEEANYHLKRCIDSGLWVADKTQQHDTVEVDMDKVNVTTNNNDDEQDDDEEEDNNSNTNNNNKPENNTTQNTSGINEVD